MVMRNLLKSIMISVFLLAGCATNADRDWDNPPYYNYEFPEFFKWVSNKPPHQQVWYVHDYFNSYITYKEDAGYIERGDYWQTLSETLERRKGDCDDYVVAKMITLWYLGFTDLEFYGTFEPVGHAVLRVGDYGILDQRYEFVTPNEWYTPTWKLRFGDGSNLRQWVSLQERLAAETGE